MVPPVTTGEPRTLLGTRWTCEECKPYFVYGDKHIFARSGLELYGVAAEHRATVRRASAAMAFLGVLSDETVS